MKTGLRPTVSAACGRVWCRAHEKREKVIDTCSPGLNNAPMDTQNSTAGFAPSNEFVGPLPQAKKRGRPAKHGSQAERQAAWRAANAVKTFRLDGKVAPTIEALAEQFDTDQTHVINNLLRFALANRNWRAMGIGGWDISDKRHAAGKRAAPQRDDSLDSFPLV